MGADKAKPAYVEDEDDTTGSPVRDSRRSAHVRPAKVTYEGTYRDRDKDRDRNREKDKEKEKRRSKHRQSHGDARYDPEQSTRPAQHVEIITDRDARFERRKSSSSSMKSPRKSGRPPSSHENRPSPKSAIPNSSKNDPSYFGIPPVSQNIPLAIRPRAQTSQTYPRPLSYHAVTPTGVHGHPLSNSAYYQPHPIITPSYPPPSPGSSYMQYAAPLHNPLRQLPPPPQTQYPSAYQYSVPPQYPQPSQPSFTMSAQPQYAMPQAPAQSDYFASKASSRPSQTSRPLSARFGEIPRSQTAFEPAPRTSSGFGNRDTRSQRVYSDHNTSHYDDGYTSAADRATIRKPERSIRVPATIPPLSKADFDAMAMPPPRRPSILRRESVYNTEPKSDPSIDYYDRDSRLEYRGESRPRRPSTKRHSVSYDLGGVRIEAANSGRRRKSTYEEPSSAGLSDGYEAKVQKASQYQGDSYEAKLNQASSYQEDVAGGPTDNLTAETLRRQQRQRKQGGSSRSTKSSASRDESDYRKSATTRTTRSGSGDNDENVTLKVTGQTRVMVGGMQIDCADGGEISIQRQKSLRNGSERSNSEYGGGRIEDRQSRVSRPSGRSRMSSHSGDSWTRTPKYPEYI
ncbi:uncharacterized protein RCO7_07288 [Rhynchosporium graminicola]|uniref:Uncharacterized protein n=1 Tax=Rhynchosporium graminicola TaxID=2792576 RepID=A0A1E1L9Y7_9HELO|nr:uncharacterized protein RCO7_07288 [Rhynchosporium commune]